MNAFNACTKNIGIALLLFLLNLVSFIPAWAENFPEPNPPLEGPRHLEKKKPLLERRALGAPTTEWTYHKNQKGTHPSNHEQALVWLMNNARKDPKAEGIFLAATTDTDVANARQYFNVNATMLKSEFAKLQKRPPAAFDIRLYNAAYEHNKIIIKKDQQNHHDPTWSLYDKAGFARRTAGQNVYAYGKSAIYLHAGWNIDWGPDAYGKTKGGMQGSDSSGRGHRSNLMDQTKYSASYPFANVGISVESESNSATQVGPLVSTADFANADTSKANHYNAFIVGTVWRDTNKNGVYDSGEGLGDVKVMPNQGTFWAKTAKSGGYAIPVTSPGDYNITFSGGQLTAKKTKKTTVVSESVLLDLTL
ncbi:MAG: hypothetical protein HZA01_02095 [Nitrospinae bacterium]|nr:hypothetical protein [Nitrospinota bacterium]